MLHVTQAGSGSEKSSRYLLISSPNVTKTSLAGPTASQQDSFPILTMNRPTEASGFGQEVLAALLRSAPREGTLLLRIRAKAFMALDIRLGERGDERDINPETSEVSMAAYCRIFELPHYSEASLGF